MVLAQHVATFFSLSLLSAAPLVAQESTPMSAIDWLSESVTLPQPVIQAPETPITDTAAVPEITVTALDDPSPDRIGLLPSDITGLPRNLWSGSPTMTLSRAIADLPTFDLPALQEFATVLMLAEADAPLDGGPDGLLFLARVDALLAMGRLDQALSLLEAAKPETPALFRRYFDIALLTGNEDDACEMMQDRPAVAPTVTARIFCLARSGDWNTAALTLNTNRLLGDLGEEEIELLTLFLDPELAEGSAIPMPERITPLVFRLREAIGETMTTRSLPIAFAHADLRSTTGWKAQLDAAERLARAGSLPATTLQALYGSRTPSASGGVWDRLDAFQRFDTAMGVKDPIAIARTLPPVWEAVKTIKAEDLLAQLYAQDLQSVPLTGEASDIAGKLGLLSEDYEITATNGSVDRYLAALAQGRPEDIPTTEAVEQVIQSAFLGEELPEDLVKQAEDGQLGIALLSGLSLVQQGAEGNYTALTQGLAFFRHVGLEDLARRTALQVLILDRQR